MSWEESWLCWKIEQIKYDISWIFKRIICRFYGCKIKGGYGGWNLPPEAYHRYCDRCGASESNYDETTDYKIIDKRGM